jgi:integrase
METKVISNRKCVLNSDCAKTAAAKWRKCLFTLHAKKRDKLTLTYLSLSGSDVSGVAKVEKADVATVNFQPCDGAGGALFVREPKTILLRRSDFLRLHDYTLHHGPLRDFCLIRVPMKCGLRPSEIRRLRWESVDFEAQTLNVTDSKKHAVFPVPMDLATADYLRELRADKTEGWVLQREKKGYAWTDLRGPLTLENLNHTVKKWARLAGCESWQKIRVYDLRHFFAANWAYPADGKRPGNLHALSKILRHANLVTTQVYLSRLVFYEDLQAEYNRLQTWPFVQPEGRSEVPAVGNEFFDRFCRVCTRRPTCRFIDQAMVSPWASGCKWFEQGLKEMMKRNRNQAGSV